MLKFILFVLAGAVIYVLFSYVFGAVCAVTARCNSCICWIYY